MKDKTNWHGTHATLHDKFVEIAENCAINTKDKGFPKDAAALGKRLRGIMSNLRHEGIFYTPQKRQSYGIPLTLEKRNEHTLPTSSYTNSDKTALSQGFNSVDNGVGITIDSKQPTLQHTSLETPKDKAFGSTNVGNVASVGENYLFGDCCTDTSNEEIPAEFLKPILPQTQPIEQLKL